MGSLAVKISRSIRHHWKRNQYGSSKSIKEAAEYLGRSDSTLKLRVRDGRLMVTDAVSRTRGMRVSILEIREFGEYLGIDTWHIPPVENVALIGSSIVKYANGMGAAFSDGLFRFIQRNPGFDGSYYISPEAVKLLRDKDIDLVASILFRYNHIQRRFRPFSCKRRIHICYTLKMMKQVNELVDKINHRFPGVAVSESYDYVISVFQRENKL